jgi:hypothetical protein
MSEIVVLSQLELPFDAPPVGPAELAAASFLARYSGRTLDSYRADLRGYFQWANGLVSSWTVRQWNKVLESG